MRLASLYVLFALLFVSVAASAPSVASAASPPVVSFLYLFPDQLDIRVEWDYSAEHVAVYRCARLVCVLLGSAALTPPERFYQEIAFADPGCSYRYTYYAQVDTLRSVSVSPCAAGAR